MLNIVHLIHVTFKILMLSCLHATECCFKASFCTGFIYETDSISYQMVFKELNKKIVTMYFSNIPQLVDSVQHKGEIMN